MRLPLVAIAGYGFTEAQGPTSPIDASGLMVSAVNVVVFSFDGIPSASPTPVGPVQLLRRVRKEICQLEYGLLQRIPVPYVA